MPNKRIRKKWLKKQEEARYYQQRIEFVGWLAYNLCPTAPRSRQLALGISLWKRDDGYLLKALEYLLRRSSPMFCVMPRPIEAPQFNWADMVTRTRYTGR